MRLGHVDLDTGEVFEHLNVVATSAKRRNGFGKSWLALSQEATQTVALNGKALGREGLTVWLYLMSVLEYENEVKVSKIDVARALGMDRSNLARAFRKLTAAGFLRETGRAGNARTYLLNPEIAWRGSGRNHIAALDSFRREKLGE